jgi:hypothetical protein
MNNMFVIIIGLNSLCLLCISLLSYRLSHAVATHHSFVTGCCKSICTYIHSLPFKFYFIGYFFCPCTYKLFFYVIPYYFNLCISSCCFFMYISNNAIFYYGSVQVKHPYFFQILVFAD